MLTIRITQMRKSKTELTIRITQMRKSKTEPNEGPQTKERNNVFGNHARLKYTSFPLDFKEV